MAVLFHTVLSWSCDQRQPGRKDLERPSHNVVAAVAFSYKATNRKAALNEGLINTALIGADG